MRIKGFIPHFLLKTKTLSVMATLIIYGVH